MTPGRVAGRPRRQRGAALLLAMLILTLVGTLAASMVWQQSRAVQVEAAERARAQAAWILAGALDWARLILREDAREGPADDDTEPWARGLPESRLSSFLAADRENNAEGGPEAFLSGYIVDAQSRYNLRNLFDDQGKPIELEVRTLRRLCDVAGLPGDVAVRIVEGLRASWALDLEGPALAAAPLAPDRVRELVWLGLDGETVRRLAPLVELLPVRTPLNANTAAPEVLAAVIEGLDRGTAERLGARAMKSMDQLRAELPPNLKAEDARVSVGSSYFEVVGRVRLDDRVLEERSLVERRGGAGGEVAVLRRDRSSLLTPGP